MYARVVQPRSQPEQRTLQRIVDMNAAAIRHPPSANILGVASPAIRAARGHGIAA